MTGKNLLLFLLFLVLGGGCTELNQIEPENEDTGSIISNPGVAEVTVTAGVGMMSSSGSSLIKTATTTDTVDNAYVRFYALFLATEECTTADSNGSFVTVFDDSSDTSDCHTGLTLDDVEGTFQDIVRGATFVTSASVAEGNYQCAKIVMCDQIIWGGTDSSNCPPGTVQDADPDLTDDSASAQTYYWSTTGSSSSELGNTEYPFYMNGFTLTEGSAVNLNVEFANSETSSSLVYHYDDVQETCDLPVPVMSIEVL